MTTRRSHNYYYYYYYYHRLSSALAVAAITLLFSFTQSFQTLPSSLFPANTNARRSGRRCTIMNAVVFSPDLLINTFLDPSSSSSSSSFTLDETTTTLSSPAAVEAARQKFWFYFFAGSGAGGIGASQLPSLFREASVARSAGAGSGGSSSSITRGGAPVNAGPFVSWYYGSKNTISQMDVSEVIRLAPTAEFISNRSTSLNYMASKGYIVKADFVKEMLAKKCNPLACYVVYDAISSGKGGVVSPVVYENKLSLYRQEMMSTTTATSSGKQNVISSSFVGDLNGFLAVKVGAFIGLVFCLLVDLGFIVNAGIQGFLS